MEKAIGVFGQGGSETFISPPKQRFRNLKYSESTLRYIGDLVNKGRLQDAVEIAKDSGKFSEDEAKSFIIQNESIFRNERTEKGSDN